MSMIRAEARPSCTSVQTLHDEPRAMAALELAYNKHENGILLIRTAPELDFIRSPSRESWASSFATAQVPGIWYAVR